MSGAVTTPSDLFPAAPGALLLHKPIVARIAQMPTPRSVRCDGIFMVGDNAITALCGAMLASGMEDSALQVLDSSSEPVCFIASIHQWAREGSHGAWSSPADPQHDRRQVPRG